MDLDLFEQLVLVVHVIAALAVIGLVLAPKPQNPMSR